MTSKCVLQFPYSDVRSERDWRLNTRSDKELDCIKGYMKIGCRKIDRKKIHRRIFIAKMYRTKFECYEDLSHENSSPSAQVMKIHRMENMMNLRQRLMKAVSWSLCTFVYKLASTVSVMARQPLNKNKKKYLGGATQIQWFTERKLQYSLIHYNCQSHIYNLCY